MTTTVIPTFEDVMDAAGAAITECQIATREYGDDRTATIAGIGERVGQLAGDENTEHARAQFVHSMRLLAETLHTINKQRRAEAAKPAFPATPKQADYLRSLLRGRVHDYDTDAITNALDQGRLAKSEAHDMIDVLTRAPFVQGDSGPAALGYYVDGDTVYHVIETKRGRHFAKRLTITEGADGRKRGRWVGERGAVYRIGDAEPLTETEAARRGHLDGICVICGAPLTDPDSVEAGIGPVCRTRI